MTSAVTTRDFRSTFKARARRDAAFREALLAEALQLLLFGEVETSEAILRDYLEVAAAR
jgi:hypothetical protein